jgi:hypothetical protein
VIWNDVEHLSQPTLAETQAKSLMRFGAAEFQIYAMLVRYIVSMFASGHRLQVRRTINVGDPEGLQIVCDSCGRIKTETGMELQPVSGERPAHSSRP